MVKGRQNGHRFANAALLLEHADVPFPSLLPLCL